jgi:uncharacterized membrane protein YeaQ/YmgE (transglycosylase-associated protein family)
VELLTLIVVGLVIGVVARLIMPGRDPIGLLGTLVVGVVGALVGGYAWRAIVGNTEDTEWIGGIIAACILLFLYRKVAAGGATARRF